MKKQFTFTAILFLLLLVTACEKDKSELRNNTKSSVSQIYYNNVMVANLDTSITNQCVCLVSNNTYNYFDNDSLLQIFCSDNHLEDFYNANIGLDSIYKKACELGLLDKDILSVDAVPQGMKDYWTEIFGAPFGQYENSDQEADTKLVWSVKLYDEANCQGDSKVCVGPSYWNLGSFNNKTSSFVLYNTGIGGIWFSEKKWYGKPRVGYFILGFPVGEFFIEYIPANHDNKFCSYLSTLH